MEALFADFTSWMEALPPLWAYAALLAIAYGENLIPPVPGDVAVVFAGYLAGRGQLDLLIVVALAAVGGALGFMTVYTVGRRLGRAILDEGRLAWLPHGQVRKAEAWIRRWGYGVVLANRFLSGARSVISLSVGMARMDAAKTAACATLSAVVWVALIAYAGYAVGDNWTLVQSYLHTYGRIVVGLRLLVAAIQLVRFYGRRRKNRRKATGDA